MTSSGLRPAALLTHLLQPLYKRRHLRVWDQPHSLRTCFSPCTRGDIFGFETSRTPYVPASADRDASSGEWSVRSVGPVSSCRSTSLWWPRANGRWRWNQSPERNTTGGLLLTTIITMYYVLRFTLVTSHIQQNLFYVKITRSFSKAALS